MGYAATSSWYRILSQVDVDAVEAVLTRWRQRVLIAITGQTPVGVRVDGKTLRGSKRQGASNSHLLSAYVADMGMALAQQGVDDKTTKLGVIDDFLLGLALQGRVVTTDALLTQHTVASQIVEQGGDYVLPVKENQPLTHEALAYWFEHPVPYDWPNGEARVCEKQHGRLTQW